MSIYHAASRIRSKLDDLCDEPLSSIAESILNMEDEISGLREDVERLNKALDEMEAE